MKINEIINEGKTGPGLWANIHAKRQRGERMRKKGAEGAPTEKALKAAQAGSKNESVTEETIHVGHRNSKGDWIKTSTHSNYPDARRAMADLEKQGKKGVQHRYDNNGSIDPGTHHLRKVDEQGVTEDDAGDVEQRMIAKMEKEKQRLSKLKQTDPEAYKREMAKRKTSSRIPPVSTFEGQGVAEGSDHSLKKVWDRYSKHLMAGRGYHTDIRQINKSGDILQNIRKYVKDHHGQQAVDDMERYAEKQQWNEGVAEAEKNSQHSHQYDTTMKHAKNPTVQQRMAAHDIKPGIAGYKDRIDLLKDLQRTGKLKDEGVAEGSAGDDDYASLKSTGKTRDGITMDQIRGIGGEGTLERTPGHSLLTKKTVLQALEILRKHKAERAAAGSQLEETYHDDDEFFEAYGVMEYNDEMINESEYQGRKVTLNKPMQGDIKKFKVYVKNPKGNVVKVNFGQKGAKIKKNNPGRRKNFRARHNCDNPGPKTGARYWSCRAW